jgi:hypothetical protein
LPAAGRDSRASHRSKKRESILKHTNDLSDEVLCERGRDNPYYQRFWGDEFFCHKLPFERSSLMRWRQRMGEADFANYPMRMLRRRSPSRRHWVTH